MYRNLQLRRTMLTAAIVAVAACLTAPPLHATTARVTSLGGGDFLEDDHNVQRWYGSLSDYPNLFLLEAGHFTLPEGWKLVGPESGIIDNEEGVTYFSAQAPAKASLGKCPISIRINPTPYMKVNIINHCYPTKFSSR